VLTTPFLPTSHSMSFDLKLDSNAAREDEPTPTRLPTLLQLPTSPRLQTLGNNLIDLSYPYMRLYASIVIYPTFKVSHINDTGLMEGAWRDIAPEDWDDSFHIKNDTVIKYSETYPMDFSMNSPNTAFSLHDPSVFVERNFLFATCGFLRTCLVGVVDATQFACNTVGNAFINKVLATSGQDVWEFLNQPYIVAITIAPSTDPSIVTAVQALTFRV
jgi:hypothetical protein